VLVGLREKDDPSPSGTVRVASVVAQALVDDAHQKTVRRHASSKSGQHPEQART
jgi:hypothetical protein